MAIEQMKESISDNIPMSLKLLDEILKGLGGGPELAGFDEFMIPDPSRER
jgi:hypothetical protein